MSGLNQASLIGRLGQDPEEKRMANGKPVVNFNVATSERWKSKEGEQKEKTTWHRIVIFNEGLCRIAMQYLKKGSQVFIQGSISNRKYEKDGQTHHISEITLQGFNSTLTMLDSRDKGSDFGHTEPQPAPSDDLDGDLVPF